MVTVLSQVNGQIDKALVLTSGSSDEYTLQLGSGDKYSEQLH